MQAPHSRLGLLPVLLLGGCLVALCALAALQMRRQRRREAAAPPPPLRVRTGSCAGDTGRPTAQHAQAQRVRQATPSQPCTWLSLRLRWPVGSTACPAPQPTGGANTQQGHPTCSRSSSGQHAKHSTHSTAEEGSSQVAELLAGLRTEEHAAASALALGTLLSDEVNQDRNSLSTAIAALCDNLSLEDAAAQQVGSLWTSGPLDVSPLNLQT